MKLSRWNAPLFVAHGIVLSEEPFRRKVAILAADPSHTAAPFDDDEWEIWSCNSLWNICKDSFGHFRADRWFEMHPMSVQTESELLAIQQCPIPIYHLGDAIKAQAPIGISYPLGNILKQFPYRYFTCTFAYQIALALHEGFKTIALYGVDLDQGTSRERLVEKACVEFWLGVAQGKGVEIVLPKSSRLCIQSHLYGYDYHEEVDEVNQLVDSFFVRRIQELERQGKAEYITFHQPPTEGNA